MKSELLKLTYRVTVKENGQLTLPESLIENVGIGDWLITIEQIQAQDHLRNHTAFLNGYDPSDEGLYDDYPIG